MLNKIRREFAIRVRDQYQGIHSNLEIIDSKRVINSLLNDVSIESNRKIKEEEEIENSNRMLINFFIDELVSINKIEKNIPMNIKPLLSPYKTFYDGNGIFYCENDLSVTETLYCVLNHIVHYCSGMYYIKTKYKKQEIMRFFAKLNILDKSAKWDFADPYIKYFDKIFRDELKDVIIFEPSNKYNKYIKELASKNDFRFATVFEMKDQKYMCIIKKMIGTSGVYNIIDNNIIGFKDKSYNKQYFNQKIRTNIIEERSYSPIAEPIKELLINNNFKIIRD